MAVATSPEITQDAVRRSISSAGRDWREAIFELGMLLTLFISLGVLVTLLWDVFAKALPVFQERGVDFLTSNLSSLPTLAGIRQGVLGSLLMMVFVVVISFPLGVGAAVYIEEYARDTRLTRFINTNIRNLAGVPSIVYGLLGLAIFVRAFAAVTGGRTLMAGGLTLAVLVLPIVIITAAEALRAVPDSIREAGYGVGATRWEVIRSHVLPYAMPGVLTGTVLSVARAFGETAPLILVGATTGFLATPGGVLDQFRQPFTALPNVIFEWSSRPQPEFQELAAAAIVVLLAILLLMNAAAVLLRNRYERKW